MAMIGADIATECGLAVLFNGQDRPRCTTLRLGGEPGEYGRPLEKLRVALRDIHKMEPITHMWFEATILPRPTINNEGHAVQRTTVHVIRKLSGLCAMYEWFAHSIKAECREVEQQKHRKHFIGVGTGKGTDLKRMAKERARALGWRVTNDHEAEAGAVLSYGMACFNIKAPWHDAGTLLERI